MKKYGFVWLVAVSVCVLSGCSPRALDEAQRTVAQADSLRAEGGMYTDSTSLAQAYTTLHAWRACYADDYAHACYHYGRLLRAQDKPVAAMQCFIAATHCRTRDYHILGRVYSNMGSIAHLAGEYSLSYDMFERSAEMFLREKDSLAYYYGLNNMAFELAEQGKKEETLSLLACIAENSKDYYLLIKTLETKADVYLYTQQYDSAILCINHLYKLGYNEPTGLLIKAQAYDNLGLKDSALFYANAVLAETNAAYQDKFNALYIVLHCDSALSIQDVNTLASQREDIRYYEYEPEHDLLSQAVQLIEQDLNRKSDLAWLYAIIATLTIVGTGISIYVYYKRKKHKLLSQKVEELNARYQTNHQRAEEELNHKCLLLRSREHLATELAWSNFTQMCHAVDINLYLLASKLKQKQILNETEIRLCVLVLLGLNRGQISDTLPYALTSVGKLKDHTAKKLGTTGKNLRTYLINLAIEGACP